TFDYLYIIHDKSQSLNAFKHFKVEIEFQFGQNIKAIKFDHGNKYYSRYNGLGSFYNSLGQHKGHAHLGCLVEARPYRSHEAELRIVSYYFLGCDKHSLFGSEGNIRNVVFEEELVVNNDQGCLKGRYKEKKCEKHTPFPIYIIKPYLNNDHYLKDTQQLQQVSLRKSTREKKNVILDYYIVFLQEYKDDIGSKEDNPIKFS
ncbi:hypothetical protein CR513_18698, partial [Mucuna pruriens]